MVNILLYTYQQLPLFGDQQNDLLMRLISPILYQSDRYTRSAIVRMINMVDEQTSNYEKETIMRCLDQIAIDCNPTPVIFIVNHGEDFSFRVTLKKDQDFTGRFLRVYNAESGDPLSDPIPGTNEKKQSIPIYDLQLSPGHTYRAHVVLEGSGNDPADILLTEGFLIVDSSINY